MHSANAPEQIRVDTRACARGECLPLTSRGKMPAPSRVTF